MGTVLTGLFATGVTTEKGLFYGGGLHFFQVQTLGVISVTAYVAIVITIVFLVIKHTLGLRADKEDELTGLDISEHGLLTAYAGYAMLPDISEEDGDEPVMVAQGVPVAEAVEVKRCRVFLMECLRLQKLQLSVRNISLRH